MNSSELISNEEMSALVPENEKGKGAFSERTNVIPYNFRRPDRLSKDQIRSIYLLHDLFAHTLSSSLPLFLRAVSEVNLISVEQQPFGDYLKGLADPTTIFTLNVPALHGGFAIEISSPIAFPVIDRMLGGVGNDIAEKRAATDLELNILEGFLGIITDSYREAWHQIVDLQTDIAGRETRPQLTQMVAQNEVVVTIAYQMTIGEATGTISICLPIVTLESVIDKFNPASYASGPEEDPEIRKYLLNSLGRVQLPVAADLEPLQIKYGELISLAVGDVIRSNHHVDSPLQIKVGGKKKFTGSLAGQNGQLVVRVENQA